MQNEESLQKPSITRLEIPLRNSLIVPVTYTGAPPYRFVMGSRFTLTGTSPQAIRYKLQGILLTSGIEYENVSISQI